MENQKTTLPINHIGYLINMTAQFFNLTALQIFKENNLNITPEQFGVLYFLSRENGMYQRQLAQAIFKDRPNITRILNILQKNGYIIRTADPQNKRITRVLITPDGQKKVETALPLLLGMKDKATTGLSEEEINTLMTILGKICGNLENNFTIQI